MEENKIAEESVSNLNVEDSNMSQAGAENNHVVFDSGGTETIKSSDKEVDETKSSTVSESELPMDDVNGSPQTQARESSLLHIDDSGVVMEKSPKSDTCDTSDAGLGTLHEEITKHDDPSTANTSACSDGVVADFIDVESGDAAATAGCCDSSSEVNVPQSEDSIASGLKESLLQSVRDEEESSIDTRVRRRRRARNLRRRLASDSDSDDSEETASDQDSSDSMEHDQSHDSSDQFGDEAMETDLDLPKDSWTPLKEIITRERGVSNRSPGAFIFRNKCAASINLVQRLNRYATLEEHAGCVNALHFNEQGTLLASGSDDLSIVVWKWMEKHLYFKFDSGHRSNVFQSKFMPYSGDTHIVSCARDGQLRLAELSSTGTCKNTKRLATHKGAAHKLALLQDSSHVFYSCGEDAVTYEVDLRQDKPHKLSITKENNRKVPLYSIHSNPFKSHEYCVSGRDPYVRVFDKRMATEGDNSGLVKKYSPHGIGGPDNEVQTNVTCAVYNYNGEEIVGSYNDEDIYLFDNRHSDGADAIHRYTGHRNNATVKGINFYGPKSEFIVGGSDCGNVFLWEKESEKVVQYFPGDQGGVVNVLEPHPDLPILATSGLDHDVKIWAPLAKEPTKLEGLKRTMQRNTREREEERQEPSEAIDSGMFWTLMQHFRRAARQRARQDGENVSSTDSDDSERESEEGDSDDEERNEPIQCVPS